MGFQPDDSFTYCEVCGHVVFINDAYSKQFFVKNYDKMGGIFAHVYLCKDCWDTFPEDIHDIEFEDYPFYRPEVDPDVLEAELGGSIERYDTYTEGLENLVEKLLTLVEQGVEAFGHTRDYVGYDVLPDKEGWSWFDWTTEAAAMLERNGR